LDHVRRLTDPRGLIRSALGDCPDRTAGYDTLDNADALRLCATASDTVDADKLHALAKTYYAYITRARRPDGGVHHGCDALGKWHDNRGDRFIQSRLARALSAVIVSELPIQMRLSAAQWWRELLVHADQARTPVAAANWLMAMSQLKSADPGRDIDRAAAMATWLLEDCYYAMRSSDWEWFAPRWTPTAACIPAGLWSAYAMLGQTQFARVARTTMQFLIDNLFEDGLLLPVGSRGGWHRHNSKAMFDQCPSEVCSIVDSLAVAAQVAESPEYHRYADYAARWFTGNNIRGENMLDAETGGCYRALRAEGTDRNQTASATVACLLAHAALNHPATIIEETTVYSLAISG